MIEMQGALKRLIHIHRFLRDFNKQSVNCETRTDLFELLCRLAVEQGGYRLAWVAIQHGDRIVPVAQFGEAIDRVPQLNCGASEQHSDPVVRSIINNSFSVLNVSHDQILPAFWQNLIERLRLQAVAVVPIRFKTKIVGVFALCSTRKGDFSDLYSFCLSEFEEDISTALEKLDDYAQRLDMELQLKQLHQAVESSATAVVVSDEHGFIQYVNPYFSELTGFDTYEVLGINYAEFIPADFDGDVVDDMRSHLTSGRQWRGEARVKTQQGGSIWVYQQVSSIADNHGLVTHYVCTLVDHTELHTAHETIEKMAYYDELTGLPNRRLFNDRLQQEINSSVRARMDFAVYFLDLDGFKNVNDTLGHEAGDKLLKKVADRIRSQVRTKDTVARLGGDEFTLIITDVKAPHDCSRVAGNIIKALQKPILVDGKEIVVTTSIGIAHYPTDGDNTIDLCRHADMAMYHAKSKGRNNFQFFTEKLNQSAEQQLELENRLRHAFNHELLELRYQPQIDGVDGSLQAVEVMLHWGNAHRYGLTSNDLYRHLESAGMMAEVFEWQLLLACRTCVSAMQQFDVRFRVAIRLPWLMLRNHDDLRQCLDRCLQISGMDYPSLQFEVPESALTDEFNNTVSILQDLRNQGAAIAIDQFGMGGSSLRFLSRFKVDLLKIDSSLVEDMIANKNDATVTSAIIALAHQLNLKVLANGVETLSHYQYLERYWCDYLQGDYLACAMSLEQFQEYLQQYRNQGIQVG